MSELIEITGLTKTYDKNKVAINNLSLTVPRGKIIGLLGPNGSGKTTLIKMMNGLLTPTGGKILINGQEPGVETKARISYLPDRTYLGDGQKIGDVLDYFADFYSDFDRNKAEAMCHSLGIGKKDRIKSMSKGTKEKLQLIMVMSRRAQLYLLDEPIAGVDPAAREYILNTILTNYNPDGTVIISTHLISDVEKVLDEVVLLKDGRIVCHDTVDHIRETQGKSVDALFRDIFRTIPYGQQEGGGSVWEE